VQQKDTYYDRLLRELSSLEDFNRPQSERYLYNFYSGLSSSSNSFNRSIPHSDLFYVRAALESRFPGRLFTIEEIKQLIKEVYDVDY